MLCQNGVNTFVEECSKQTVRDFVTYLRSNSAYHNTMKEKCESFLQQALLETTAKKTLIVVSLETYGLLASAIKKIFLCCYEQVG